MSDFGPQPVHQKVAFEFESTEDLYSGMGVFSEGRPYIYWAIPEPLTFIIPQREQEWFEESLKKQKIPFRIVRVRLLNEVSPEEREELRQRPYPTFKKS